MRLISARDRLLAMTGLGEIWRSQAFSAGWEKMAWPYAGTPYSWYAEGDSVWIGTEKPGRLYGCAVSSWVCRDMKPPIPDSLMVDHIRKYQGNLVVFATAYKTRFAATFRGGAWDNSLSNGFPIDAPYRTFAMGDTLWAGTWESGLWYRVASESAWTRQRAPRMTWYSKAVDSVVWPRGLAWHHGALWVADWSGEVTRMPGGRAPYVGVSNCPNNASGCRSQPSINYALLSYRDRLYLGGYNGAAPYVLDEATGFWITTEIAGWCWSDGDVCGGKRTWDLVGLGDTLYSASSRFIMKIPLAEIPTFSPDLMTRFGWSPDTSWRNSVLRRNNPVGP